MRDRLVCLLHKLDFAILEQLQYVGFVPPVGGECVLTEVADDAYDAASPRHFIVEVCEEARESSGPNGRTSCYEAGKKMALSRQRKLFEADARAGMTAEV